MPATILVGVVNGAVYGLLALGIVLVYKGSRVLNFAQGEIGGFALFVTWWLVEQKDLPWAVGGAAGIMSAVVIAVVFNLLVIRPMGNATRLAVAVSTVGLFLFLLAAEAFIWKQAIAFLRAPIQARGIPAFGIGLSPTAMLALGTLLVVGLGLAAFLRYTDFGLGVLAASQDSDATRLVGIKVSRVSMFTWVSAGVLGAVAALLIEPIVGIFAPGFMTEFFIRALAAALLGGMTSLPGAFVGGITVGVVEAIIVRQVPASAFPGAASVAMLVIIILVLLVRPSGILGGRTRTA
jgi:branched-chain amino acid transport system permease protein